MTVRRMMPSIAALGALTLIFNPAFGQVTRSSAPPERTRVSASTVNWRQAERDILADHVQLTSEDRYFKAGEAYFSADNRWIIFQAVEQPEQGGEPDPFYAMFVARLQYEGDKIVGCDDAIRVSNPGSANTCGWFDPLDTSRVYFGSTITPPTPSEAPGFQRDNSKYKWMMPGEMEIVTLVVPQIFEDLHPGAPLPDASKMALSRLTNNDTYDAEDSLTSDGRYLLYASLGAAPNLCDLFVKDLVTNTTVQLTNKPGYDGGPFFSPDGKRITYRSDRHGNNLLQIFVADLQFDADGRPTGIKREYQVTDDAMVVNWCPYFHPAGRHLVFASSRLGHQNYEVFMTSADPGNLPGSDGTIRYGMRTRQVTHGPGFDGLPVFNSDGSYMMWTSQRTMDGTTRESSQIWVARFVMELDPVDPVPQDPTAGH